MNTATTTTMTVIAPAAASKLFFIFSHFSFFCFLRSISTELSLRLFLESHLRNTSQPSKTQFCASPRSGQRRKAHFIPTISKTQFCATWIKGHCPLRVWAAPTKENHCRRQSFGDSRTHSQPSKTQFCASPRSGQRRKAHFIPTISKTQFCATWIKGHCPLRVWAAPTKENHCRRQSFGDSRTHSQPSKTQFCASPRSGQMRLCRATLPKSIKTQVCAPLPQAIQRRQAHIPDRSNKIPFTAVRRAKRAR